MKKLILLALLLPIAAFAQTGQGSGNVTIQFAVIPASCVVTPVAPTIPPNLPSGSTQSFTFTFTQNGGCLGTTSWSMVPTTAAGLTMSTTGVLSGTVATCTTGNCNTSAVISVTFAGVILPKTGERVGAGHSELQMGVPTKHTTAWVDAMWKLKPGHSVIFDGEDGDRRWTCVRVGSIVMEYQEINSRWKVGGL